MTAAEHVPDRPDLPGAERAVAAAGALARHGRERAAMLCSLTDEQLEALLGSEQPDGLRTPWLDDPGRRVHAGLLRASAVRALVAQGALAPEAVVARIEERDVDGDPRRVVPSMLVLGVLARCALSPRTITVHEPTAPRGGAVVVHVDADGTLMTEQISPEGIHHFQMCPPDAVADLLLLELCAPRGVEELVGIDGTCATGTGALDEILARQDVAAHIAPDTRELAIDLADKGVDEIERIGIRIGRDAALVMRPEEGEGSDPGRVEAVLTGSGGLTALVREIVGAS